MNLKFLILRTTLLLLVTFAILGCNSVLESSKNNKSDVWKMHHINSDYLIANSLNAADVDGDGFEDYAVIDEWLGIQTIVFYPNELENIKQPWERVNLGTTGNPEYSCLGDIDSDGNVDFIAVTGDDLERGYSTGIAIFWGPEKSKVKDSTAWEYSGYMPTTVGQQYLYVQCHDIDGDGALDILAGGRRNAVTNEYAGIRWLKAPKNGEDRRDLSKWTQYFIDADAYSGHGFVFADINQDGHKDMILGDADWDTPAFERKLYWYENPGNSDAVLKPWKYHLVWKSSSFYAKPQVGIGDVNDDGLVDLCTQTQNFVHVFVKKGNKPVEWEHIKIKKPESVQWIGRPIKFADLNLDGKLDIVGMLIHNDGNLPSNKASVFWLEFEGDKPTENWKFHTIKWGDGYNSYKEWVGEKWDHCIIRDVDQDGDPDLVGNVEEHFKYTDGKKLPTSMFSVVWFENPLK